MEKATTFAEHLSQVFSPHPSEDPPEAYIKPLNTISTLVPEEPFKIIIKKKVLSIIKRTNPKKAPGYDLITGRLLKQLSDIGYLPNILI